jgi:hypothetical protein
MRDENNPDYRYGKRHERMIEYIASCPSDVISIKELRTCKTPDGDKDLTPNSILQDFAQNSRFRIAGIACTKLHPTDGIPTYNPFYIGQLYDEKKLVVVNSHVFRYYPEVFRDPINKPHVGTAFLAVEYAPLVPDNRLPDLKNSFIVETCHFPLAEFQKDAVCKWFVENELPSLERVFGNLDRKTIIRTGDFNTFRDKEESKLQTQPIGEEWIRQRERNQILCTRRIHDCLWNLLSFSSRHCARDENWATHRF